jgi:hypothetical protein
MKVAVRAWNWQRLGIGAAIVVAVVRIWVCAGYYTETVDEYVHVQAGLEWLERGDYTVDTPSPPIARVAVVLLPYLSGVRLHHATDTAGGVFHGTGDYWKVLRLARAGTIPFFILACVVIAMWASRWMSEPAAFWAVLVFSNLPPVLAHASLATVDMACAATVLLALYAGMRWIEAPTWQAAVFLSVSLALAMGCKFSSAPFLGGCAVVSGLFLLSIPRGRRVWAGTAGRRLQAVMILACLTTLLLWACYRFQVVPIGVSASLVEWTSGHPDLYATLARLGSVPFPLSRLVQGVMAVADHNRVGHHAYLLGQYGTTGWWYFFPVLLAVKTPLGLLVLALTGLGLSLWRLRAIPWQHAVTALCPLVILAVCLPLRINIGLRYALPIYPLLALLSGWLMAVVLGKEKRLVSALVVLGLLSWGLGSAWKAHPDYLAYFNELAGAHPEHITVDSDLDWGQDLCRLSERLRQLGVKRVSIAYFGSAEPGKADLPAYSLLSPTQPTPGYVAISVRHLMLGPLRDGSYGWLKQYKPVERVGKSIYLYTIP